VAENPKKCAHPGCACIAAKDSKYCGTYCESNDKPAILCECGHPACKPKV
jgi:hypothetical protein